MTVTPTDHLHPSWKKSTIVPLQTTGSQNGENSMEILSAGTSAEDNQTEKPKSKYSISIKTSSIAIFLMVVLLCVLSLTAIWVAFFADTIHNMTKSLTESQFSKITQYTENAFREMAAISDTLKNQLIVALGGDHSNIFQPKVMKHLHNTYFNEIKYHSGFVSAVTLHSRENHNHGILMVNNLTVSQTIQNDTAQYRYPCTTLTIDDGCIREVYPVVVSAPNNDLIAHAAIRSNPGRPVYTPTYKSSDTGGDGVFIALINSYSAPSNTSKSTMEKPFDWFLSLEIAVDHMSTFLKNAISQYDVGSIGLIIESKTNYIISTSKPEISITGRITPDRHKDSDIQHMHRELQSRYTTPLNTSLQCNTLTTHMFPNRVTSVHRMCSPFDMDWIIVFSVPQSVYTGPMIIAICVALGISLFIIVGGVVIGIVYSVQITKPLKNLIALLEKVSKMELDHLHIKPTIFSEFSKLQDQFLTMAQQIKQYRVFIPAHILHQLENQDRRQDQEGNTSTHKPHSSHVLGLPSAPKRRSSLNSNVGLETNNSSSTMKSTIGNSLFKIGFEKRRISFMVIYLDGFNLWVQNLSFSEITHLLTDIYEVLQKASLTNGAQVGNFENESIFLSWNSSEKSKFHELKAAHTATTLRERLLQLRSTRWEQKEIFSHSPKMLELFKIRLGICSQHSLCGNVGTKHSKSFTIIGSAYNNLQIMMSKAKKYNLGIVVTHDVNVEISTDFHSRFITSSGLLFEECTTSPLMGTRKTEKIKLYEVGDSKSIEMDEWMYELHSSEQKNKWKMYNEACSRYFCDEFEEALPLFREYLLQNPHDLPTLRMIERCKKGPSSK